MRQRLLNKLLYLGVLLSYLLLVVAADSVELLDPVVDVLDFHEILSGRKLLVLFDALLLKGCRILGVKDIFFKDELFFLKLKFQVEDFFLFLGYEVMEVLLRSLEVVSSRGLLH